MDILAFWWCSDPWRLSGLNMPRLSMGTPWILPRMGCRHHIKTETGLRLEKPIIALRCWPLFCCLPENRMPSLQRKIKSSRASIISFHTKCTFFNKKLLDLSQKKDTKRKKRQQKQNYKLSEWKARLWLLQTASICVPAPGARLSAEHHFHLSVRRDWPNVWNFRTVALPYTWGVE